VWETSPDGPVRELAHRAAGFEYFYGFIGGEAHQYYPALLRGHDPGRAVGTPEEGYHLMGDMTDKAIRLGAPAEVADARQAVLRLLRPGATHAPHHVPKEWADKYSGRFDAAGTRCARRSSRARSSSA
jgi:arylsulfatase